LFAQSKFASEKHIFLSFRCGNKIESFSLYGTPQKPSKIEEKVQLELAGNKMPAKQKSRNELIKQGFNIPHSFHHEIKSANQR